MVQYLPVNRINALINGLILPGYAGLLTRDPLQLPQLAHLPGRAAEQ